MSYQATYAVYGLDLRKNYNELEKSKDVKNITNINKGTFSFFLIVNKVPVRVQIANDSLNIWHKKTTNIGTIEEKLKSLVVNANGERCDSWLRTRYQKIGSTPLASPLTEEIDFSTKIEEADPEDVKLLLDALERHKDSLVLEFDIKNLSNLANNKGIAHIPNVLPFLENALKDTKFQDAKLLKGLIQLIEFMLFFERRSTSPRQDLIDRIQNDILSSIIWISKNVNDEEVLRAIIYCLGKTDREESVDAISNIVERVNADLYHNLKSSVTVAFFHTTSSLQKSQQKHINENIRKLIEHHNPKIRERGTELANYPR